MKARHSPSTTLHRPDTVLALARSACEGNPANEYLCNKPYQESCQGCRLTASRFTYKEGLGCIDFVSTQAGSKNHSSAICTNIFLEKSVRE